MRQILSNSTIYLIGLAFFLHGLAQVGMVSWIGQLYQLRFKIDAAQAAYFISINSAGFFVGRSLLSWITARWKIPELVILSISAGGGTLAFIASIVAKTYFSGLFMFAIAGMFISGDGPSISSYTGARFVGRSAMAFALMGGFGNIGAAAGPYLTGFLGNQLGLEQAIWFMPVFSFVLALLALIWYMQTRPPVES
jgi:fucose permease